MTDDDGRRAALSLARARAAAGLDVDVGCVGLGLGRDAVALAAKLGAPLGPVLQMVVAMDDDRRRLTSEVRRASAEGRAVAVGLVVGPPVLGLVVSGLVTDEPLTTLTSPAGRSLLMLAALLWGAGLAVVVAAVRRVSRPLPAADRTFVLAAVALRAGEPLTAALRLAADVGRARRDTADPAALALWLDLGAVGTPPLGWDSTGAVLAEAVANGVAVAPLLDDLGRERRRAAHARGLERAARLGAQLSVPTALLLLPAGLLLAAGPLLLAVLADLG